jgi:hypothetical protein
MSNHKTSQLLDDWQSTHPDLYPIVDSIYQRIKQLAPELIETVKYGGILFAQNEEESSSVCGVFVYAAHVSLEFTHGAEFDDPFQQLEGSGKFRRHLKFKTPSDLETKQIDTYIALALKI